MQKVNLLADTARAALIEVRNLRAKKNDILLVKNPKFRNQIDQILTTLDNKKDSLNHAKLAKIKLQCYEIEYSAKFMQDSGMSEKIKSGCNALIRLRVEKKSMDSVRLYLTSLNLNHPLDTTALLMEIRDSYNTDNPKIQSLFILTGAKLTGLIDHPDSDNNKNRIAWNDAIQDFQRSLPSLVNYNISSQLKTVQDELNQLKLKIQNEERAYNFTLNAGDSISFKKTSPIAAIFFENDRHAIQIVQKLSSFLNDAALAQGDKQLAKVVESYALPAGSYKRKRNNWWSVDFIRVRIFQMRKMRVSSRA